MLDGIIDEIISEPLGGAHRDKSQTLESVRSVIRKNIQSFKEMSSEEIINDRKNKFLRIGRQKGFISNNEDLSTLLFSVGRGDGNTRPVQSQTLGIGVKSR